MFVIVWPWLFKHVLKDCSGVTIFPLLVFVAEGKRYDQALIAHERTHAKRQAMFLWLPWLLFYFLAGLFRRDEEARALAAEYTLYPGRLDMLAESLVNDYHAPAWLRKVFPPSDFSLTIEQAKARIKEYA